MAAKVRRKKAIVSARRKKQLKIQRLALKQNKVLHIAVNSEPPVVVLSPDHRALAIIPATVVNEIVPERGETWWEYLFGK